MNIPERPNFGCSNGEAKSGSGQTPGNCSLRICSCPLFVAPSLQQRAEVVYAADGLVVVWTCERSQMWPTLRHAFLDLTSLSHLWTLRCGSPGFGAWDTPRMVQLFRIPAFAKHVNVPPKRWMQPVASNLEAGRGAGRRAQGRASRALASAGTPGAVCGGGDSAGPSLRAPRSASVFGPLMWVSIDDTIAEDV